MIIDTRDIKWEEWEFYDTDGTLCKTLVATKESIDKMKSCCANCGYKLTAVKKNKYHYTMYDPRNGSLI